MAASFDSVVKFEGVRVAAETPKAYLCTWAGDHREHWVPKSQIHTLDEGAGTLVVNGWWAEKAGVA